VEGPVTGQKRWRLRAGDLVEGFIQGIRGHRGIEAAQGILDSAGEQDLLEGLTLRCGLLWGDVGAEDGCVAEGGEPGKSRFFNEGFCKGHDLVSPLFLFGPNSSQISWIGFSSNAFFIAPMAF